MNGMLDAAVSLSLSSTHSFAALLAVWPAACWPKETKAKHLESSERVASVPDSVG